MSIVHYADSALSLIPPVVALSLAIITRQVLLSLGIGIITGALLLADFSLLDTMNYLFGRIKGLFIEDGGINQWNMSIVLFLLLLGMTTALLTLSGGSKAFANWVQGKIHSKRGAKLMTACLGVFIFVDDYFNSLAVGSISRPVTDKLNVSRAKLAYILDSTAAPICVLMPASSWGAYIITLIGGILLSNGITDTTALGAFMQLIPMNFYAIFALLLVFVVAWLQIDIGPMRHHESLADDKATLSETEEKSRDLDAELDIPQSDHGRVRDLVVPIVVLVIATVASMLWTGQQALAKDNKTFNLLGAFENTDVGTSLCYGGLIGLVTALVFMLRQKLATPLIGKALWVGAKSMFGAILILFFAWTIGSIIKDLETGKYLSTLAQGNISPQWLPLILFVLSGAMAFATGTSWGTFGIMLPIAGDLAMAADSSLMLPVLAAVLSGAVFGDHCSPISDTTILSSTGAKCNHIEHVTTQLPYALLVAGVAAIGYTVLGFSQSVGIAFAVTLLAFIISVVIIQRFSARTDNMKNI